MFVVILPQGKVLIEARMCAARSSKFCPGGDLRVRIILYYNRSSTPNGHPVDHATNICNIASILVSYEYTPYTPLRAAAPLRQVTAPPRVECKACAVSRANPLTRIDQPRCKVCEEPLSAEEDAAVRELMHEAQGASSAAHHVDDEAGEHVDEALMLHAARWR